MTRQANRLPLFPVSTTIEADELKIDGQGLVALAERYSTPLYLLDRATMDAAVAAYRMALRTHYPGTSMLTFAGKAFLCKAIAQWADQQRIWLDCTGAGEIAIAVAARMPAASLVVHGVNKSAEDLEAAVMNARTIVIDNLDELRRIAGMSKLDRTSSPAGRDGLRFWLRLQPAVAVETHAHTQTGHAEAKFGMTPSEIVEAAAFCKRSGLRLAGIHFHLGSNFREAAPLATAIEHALQVAREIDLGQDWHFCPGGGWGVAYHEDELPGPNVEDYVRTIAQELVKRCRDLGLKLPILHLEPGRSLIARAGVALYRVGAVKQRGHRTWLLTDGGLADNPRYALYAAKYSCLPAIGVARQRTELTSIAGPYCESGDVLIEDLPMPRIEAGELLAIPVSGAYQLSMASNYNGARRPAVVWLERGRARLIVRRETTAEISQRHLSLL